MDTQPQTYQELINAIHLNALNDPTPPAVGSQEYNMYSQFINTLAIPAWENERGVLWNELWTPAENYATLTAKQGDIRLQDDFKFIGGGYVRMTMPGSATTSPNIVPVPVRRLPEIELNPIGNQRLFYVYGNISTGFFLKLGWTIQTGAAEVGATISFRYYKYAARLVQLNDVPEMSDPPFIVYKSAAAVARNNYNMNLYTVNEDLAIYSLKNMRIGNEMSSNFMDDYVKDVDGLTSRPPGHRDMLQSPNSTYF